MINKLWLRLGFLFVTPSALAACATRTPPVPPAVEVMVPVPVACEIEQVPEGPRPTDTATASMGIFELTQRVLAERQVLLGENARLRAANTSPCEAP